MKFTKYEKRGVGYHWEQISRSVLKRNIFSVARYNVVFNQVTSGFSGGYMIDVGCGDGVLSYLLSSLQKSFVIGIDTSDDVLIFAKRRTKHFQNIEFIKASAYHLPFKGNSIDYVICSDVIEHLREPGKMLSEIKRIVNKTGKAIITTPLRLTEAPIDKMHIQEFFESDLKELLSYYFGTNVRIIKSHPLVFMELQNKHLLVKVIFNLLNLLSGYNPFKKTKGWRYYTMQTAIIEEQHSQDIPKLNLQTNGSNK
jgi:ubiquinone/menaquinone biosynthesis C-methylase UbiE